MLKYDDKTNTIVEVQSLPKQEFLQVVEVNQQKTRLIASDDGHSAGSAQ